ncbi:MAG: DUF2318 domain-containing protein [Treponema sp.]|nr:DUF2318 domain-containing protein [Treponema sp.]
MGDKMEKNNFKILTAVFTVVFMLMSGVSVFARGDAEQDRSLLNQRKPKTVNQDLVIQIADLNQYVSFYPIEIDGMLMEIMAVKIPDGSIRTAFNACHYCYQRSNDPAALGYFTQTPGPQLVSLCGSERVYAMDKIQASSDACHPEPITIENKKVAASTLTISKEYLLKAKKMFGEMKSLNEKGSCCD